MTSLDDLLSDSDEGRGPRTPVGRAVWWLLRAAAVAAALAGAMVLALYLLGVAVPFALPFGGFFALAVLLRAVRRLRAVPPRRLGGGEPASEGERPGPDGLTLAVSRWQERINHNWVGRNDFRKSATLMLAELVDERLRLRHGITRGSDPARARALLGHRLWSHLADPSARQPSARDLSAILTPVERL